MTSLTDTSSLDRTDRLLLGGAAAVWLLALGAGVAATVALVNLGSGTARSTADSGTPWILYTIIGVSAAVIIAAVPLLLRARRTGQEESTPVERRMAQRATGATAPAAPSRAVDAPTEKLRVPPPADYTNSGRLPRILLSPGVPTVVDSPAVDRVWLQHTASLAAAMGAGTLLVSIATYLLAVDSATAAWVVLGVAGVVTIGMAAIPWYFLRQLRAALDH